MFVQLFLLALSGLIANNCQAFLWKCKDDSFGNANVLLVESGPNAKNLIDNIKLAKTILESQQFKDPKVSTILKQLVALESIEQNAKNGKLECSLDEFSKMRAIHQSMLQHSKEDAYKEPRSLSRLNKLVIELQKQVGSFCLAKFRNDFSKLDPKKVNLDRSFAMSRMTELLSGLRGREDLIASGVYFLDKATGKNRAKYLSNPGLTGPLKWYKTLTTMHKAIHESYRLRVPDEKTGKLSITRDRVKDLFEDIIDGTCEFVEQQQELSELLTRVMRLAESIRLTSDMIFERDSQLHDMSSYAATLQLCKDIKSLDREKLFKTLASDINRHESHSIYEGIEAESKYRR